MEERCFSIDYILYACDYDYALAEKLCNRLNGLHIKFSINQLKNRKAKELFIKGYTAKSISKLLDIPIQTAFNIRNNLKKEKLCEKKNTSQS